MTDGITRRRTLAAIAGGGVAVTSSATPSDGLSRQAPSIRPRSALERLREGGAGVGDTGAIGDGRADDTAAIQEIADYFGRTGGEWHLPQGVYRTTAPLIVNCAKPQRLVGRGKRRVYPGAFDPQNVGGLAVICPTHAGRAALLFVGSDVGDGSIELRDVALATLETGAVPMAGFGWDAGAHFLRDFSFIGCSVHGFTSAFDLFKARGTNTEMGMFKARRCTINRNRWIARTLDKTQWNGFFFCQNEAGQNGYDAGSGGIAITAHNAVIADNCLEGQRDAIRLSGGTRGVSIRDNYFEANVGSAAIHLQNIPGPFDVGAHTFLAIDDARLDHRVLLTNCGHGRVLGPYWPDGVHKVPPPVVTGGGGSAGTGLLRLDGFDLGNRYGRLPRCSAITRQRVAIAGRERTPWNDLPFPVAHHDTARAAGIVLDYDGKGRKGDWAVMSWLFRREPDTQPFADPYVSLSINGSAGPGSRDYIAYGFDEHWRPGEWCLLTAAIKLGVEMSRLSLGLYPFGTKPSGRRVTAHLNPIVYVTQSPDDIIPYIDDQFVRSVTKPPIVDGFEQGDVLLNGAVTAAGQSHFIKLAGAPDRWAYQ